VQTPAAKSAFVLQDVQTLADEQVLQVFAQAVQAAGFDPKYPVSQRHWVFERAAFGKHEVHWEEEEPEQV
jgi:hypothetical protein